MARGLIGTSMVMSSKCTDAKRLVTNYGEGGCYKRGGGACEVLPLRKWGGGRKKF